MDFSGYHNNDNLSNNESDLSLKDNIIVLKRVKSIRQLKITEKEWVRLCYKEALLKGMTYVKDIQYYVASKTKIWIERTGIEYLKKSEEEENKKWYYYLAKDHFAYVGVYRKAVDELDQIKKGLWEMMTDSKPTNIEKVQILKELHNLTKTYTLLLRDLPFVTNLSQYYDLNLANSSLGSDSTYQYPQTDIDNEEREKKIIERKMSHRHNKLIDESGLYVNLTNNNALENQNPSQAGNKITDEVMNDMDRQITDKDHIEKMFNSDKYHQSIRKIKEIVED